jgi:hypothetical protein
VKTCYKWWWKRFLICQETGSLIQKTGR